MRSSAPGWLRAPSDAGRRSTIPVRAAAVCAPPSAVTDAISLTVPHARSYAGVVRLVVGGLAARLDLPYESLEDLQVALESLLATDAYAAGADVTLEVGVIDGRLEVAVGPLNAAALEHDLAGDADARRGVGLGRVLTTVTGGYELERRDGAEWLRLRKDVS